MVLVLASEFQGFARELHYECAEWLASSMAQGDQNYFEIIRNNLTAKRELDSANAKPSSLTADFSRLGVSDLWGEIESADPSGVHWHNQLGILNTARNAIAHNNPIMLQGLNIVINVPTIRSWRAACNGVSKHMDATMKRFLTSTTGRRPW
jgi:hypothetical protein